MCNYSLQLRPAALIGVGTVMGIVKENGLIYEQLQKKFLLFRTALLLNGVGNYMRWISAGLECDGFPHISFDQEL